MKPIISLIIPLLANTNSPIRIFEYIFNLDPKIELIVIINGKNEEEINKMKKRFMFYESSNIKIYSDKHCSPGQARNIGLTKASAEWVMFCDSDDIPQITEAIKITEESTSRTADIIICNYTVYDEIKLTESINGIKHLPTQIYFQLGIWRMIFRKELIENIHFPKIRMGEDQVFFARALNKNPKILFEDRNLYRYYTNNTFQLTKNISVKKDIFECIKLLQAEYKCDRKCEVGKLLGKQNNSGAILLLKGKYMNRENITTVLRSYRQAPHLIILSFIISLYGHVKNQSRKLKISDSRNQVNS